MGSVRFEQYWDWAVDWVLGLGSIRTVLEQYWVVLGLGSGLSTGTGPTLQVAHSAVAGRLPIRHQPDPGLLLCALVDIYSHYFLVFVFVSISICICIYQYLYTTMI